MMRALRTVAVLIAVAAAIDPSVSVYRRQPIRVAVLDSSTPRAFRLRDRLSHDLGREIVFDSGDPPDAIVIAGPLRDALTPPDAVPVSVVMPGADARNVQLIDASTPDRVLLGHEAIVTARFEATGMKGQSSIIVLEQGGIQLAATTHQWTRDREQFTARLSVVAPAVGIAPLTVLARTIAGEARDDDNAADVALMTVSPTLRIGVYEPRPSWAIDFVRRALEADPRFSTASLVRPSSGRRVTAGPPLMSLTARTLMPLDAVLVGAPEELKAADVATLAAFCETRGGAVIFAPDRTPTGPYTDLLSATGFDEVLLDKPVVLGAETPIGIRASEFALPKRLPPGATMLASIAYQGQRDVIVSIPRGRGRIVFSGALDAWRFRAAGATEAAYTRFWTGLMGNLALSSHHVSVSVRPAVAAPGERLAIRTSFDPMGYRIADDGEGPRVRAAVSSGKSEQPVRLWPAVEPGVFTGEFVAPAVGINRVVTRGPISGADTSVLILNDVRHPPAYDDKTLRLIAAATGGVVVDPSDLTALNRHLRSLPRRAEPRARQPMRSSWWSVPFAAALCAEWAIRRRRGGR